MYKVLAAVIALSLLLAFQNCAQQGTTVKSLSDSGQAQAGSTSTSSQDLAQDTAKLQSMSAVEVPLTSNVYSAGPQKVAGEEAALRISRLDGRIDDVDSNGNVIQRYCLHADELAELNSIISISKVCYVDKHDEDQLCAQVLKPAYASMYNSQEKLPLGAANDACGNGAKVLCGNQDQMLRSFLAAVKSNYQQRPCPQ